MKTGKSESPQKEVKPSWKRRAQALPSGAQSILAMAKAKLPVSEFRDMRREFVRVYEFSTELKGRKDKPLPIAAEKMQGSLGYLAGFVSDVGIYNPDEIPIGVYKRMSRDATIALGLATIRKVPQGLSYTIACKDKLQRNLVKKQVDCVYSRFNYETTTAVKYGVSVGELIWNWERMKIEDDENSENVLYEGLGWKLEKIKFVDPGTIMMRCDPKGNLVGVTQFSTNEGLIPVDIEKLVVYSHEGEFDNWWGVSRLKNIYPDWYWCLLFIHFMLKYYERKGTPLTKMRAPLGTRTDEKGNKVNNLDWALSVGKNAASSSVVVVPAEFDKMSPNNHLWDMEYLEDQQRGEMFIDGINFFETRKLRGLFIPDRLGLAADGSKHSPGGASAGDSMDVFMLIQQALVNDIEGLWNEVIIPKIQEYNFAKEEIVEAKIQIEKLDYSKKLLFKDVLLRMIMLAGSMGREGGAAKFLPSIKKMCETLGVPFDDIKDIFDAPPAPVEGGDIEGEGGGSEEDPTDVEKKKRQDANNGNRGTPRAERGSRDRSMREKRS